MRVSLSRLSPAKFSTPQTLKEIRRDLLLAWLRPFSGYLQNRGLFLPASESNHAIDYDKLAGIFMEPSPDMPGDLQESLFLIHGMATRPWMDRILEGLESNELDAGPEDELTPADVAVKAWLLDRGLLQRLHNFHEITLPRSFSYFSTDASPLPEFAGPTREQMARLEERLNAFFVAWRRGRGARLFAYQRLDSDMEPTALTPAFGSCGPSIEQHAQVPDSSPRASSSIPREWWFLIRHGAPCRREGAMDKGEPTTVFYRPQSHDVLVYDATRGEMRVNCCSARERTVLLRIFGQCLFGRNDFFPGTAKYTLAPLVRRGRDSLACADVPGIEQVRLTEVEFFYENNPWKRVIQKADDIFTLIERSELSWPGHRGQIVRATFKVKFWRAKKPRRLTIVPCNKALYGCDDDSTLLEQWLEAREFVMSKAE
jgi:hypothetical protein